MTQLLVPFRIADGADGAFDASTFDPGAFDAAEMEPE